jgi:hypothetical protein
LYRYAPGAGGRVAASDILKDLDLDHKFRLEAGARDRLMRTLGEDCALLEELRVMDYSLLVGVHFRKTAAGAAAASDDAAGSDGEGESEVTVDIGGGGGTGGGSSGINGNGSINGGGGSINGGGGSINGDGGDSLGGGTSDDGSDQHGEVCKALRKLSASFSGKLGARRRSFGHLDPVLSIAPPRTPDGRPSPGGAGGSDAIAHALGDKEVRMGVNMVGCTS